MKYIIELLWIIIMAVAITVVWKLGDRTLDIVESYMTPAVSAPAPNVPDTIFTPRDKR